MVSFHIDLDTPHMINRFYGGEQEFNTPNDSFCYQLLDRVAEFFDKQKIKATFFVITEDLKMEKYKNLLHELETHGHEIASHTHTHPYFDQKVDIDTIRYEIRQSYQEIKSHFCNPPVGFRAPGFFMNQNIIRTLEEEGYKYDSSILSEVSKLFIKLGCFLYGKSVVFGNSKAECQKALNRGNLKEFFMPSFAGIPYYNNTILSLPSIAQNIFKNQSARNSFSPYLFHLIEFSDNIIDKENLSPASLKHPNIRSSIKTKMSLASKVIENFKNQGLVKLTKDII